MRDAAAVEVDVRVGVQRRDGVAAAVRRRHHAVPRLYRRPVQLESRPIAGPHLTQSTISPGLRSSDQSTWRNPRIREVTPQSSQQASALLEGFWLAIIATTQETTMDLSGPEEVKVFPKCNYSKIIVFFCYGGSYMI